MKTIVNIRFILSVLIIISSCNSNKNDSNKNDSNKNNSNKNLVAKTRDPVADFVIFSVDTARAITSNSKRLDFYYHDSLAYGHPVVIAGKSTKLLLNVPTLLLEASDKQTPFLISPGEKINIKYAGSDSVQMYVQGNQQRTNELNFFRKLVQKTGNIYYGWKIMPYHKKVNTLKDMYTLGKAIYNVKNSRLQFLNSFARQSPISDSFIKIATNTIKSTALTDSLLLYYNNRELLNKQNLYKKLISQKLTTIKNIGFMPFQVYYRACNTLVSMSTNNGPDYTIANSDEFAKRFDFIAENFDGAAKDFSMSNTLYTAHSNDIPISKEYLNKFNTQCANEAYKKLIDKKLNEKQTFAYVKGTNNLLFADGKTTQDMQTVISNYKGKIALLDFWASWCSPCRGEMPFLREMKKIYKGKNIVFVSISKDTNIDIWIAANKEESLGNVNSFCY